MDFFKLYFFHFDVIIDSHRVARNNTERSHIKG